MSSENNEQKSKSDDKTALIISIKKYSTKVDFQKIQIKKRKKK